MFCKCISFQFMWHLPDYIKMNGPILVMWVFIIRWMAGWDLSPSQPLRGLSPGCPLPKWKSLKSIWNLSDEFRLGKHERLPGRLFTKRTDVLPQDIAKFQSHEIGCYNGCIALKFDRHLGSSCRDACQISERLVTDHKGTIVKSTHGCFIK